MVVDHLTALGDNIRSGRERATIRAERWAETILQPLFWPAGELVNAMGAPAQGELSRAVRQPDRKLQKAAAILLVTAGAADRETVAEVRSVLSDGITQDSIVAMLLAVVLARGGDARLQQEITRHAREQGLEVAGWILKTVDTAVLDLLGWEREICL